MSRKKLESRIVAIHEGRWMELLREHGSSGDRTYTISPSEASSGSRWMTRGGLHEPCLSPRWANCQQHAAGPSGMTSDHLFPVLENEGDSELLCRVASLLSVEQVAHFWRQFRLGRMTPLSKPVGEREGGREGVERWRCLAEISGKDDREASHREGRSSHNSHALSTKAGCECVAHILQTFTDLEKDQILSFLRCFYQSPSTYLWEDEMGTQYVSQGEGGEQGDPFMPLLFALGQHRTLEAIHERMRPGEHLMAVST